ncbi:MAG TPA: Do family serine endopeptidase [Steroidobacteraceae bacterium]|nr:Do family serine endopeptidase [Steroidobacteraceae bacterium]
MTRGPSAAIPSADALRTPASAQPAAQTRGQPVAQTHTQAAPQTQTQPGAQTQTQPMAQTMAQPSARTTPQPSAPEQASSQAAAQASVRALPDFSALVDSSGKAVVNVVSVRVASASTDEDPLSQFFRRFGVPGGPGGPGAPGEPDGPGAAPDVPGGPDGPGGPSGQGAPVERGEGSGFIVSPDGYVLTNAHVVDQSTQITVKLSDRREFIAKVIGVDLRGDVAVLKIDAHDLPTVRIGDPSRLKPGHWVIAIGAPFGFENSVTAGVVSATARAVGDESSIVPLIQTDVAVNPGNSGGPLFNLDGEVVGMNSMIYSGTGGYQGVSFAIPIDVALDVEQQLLKTGKVTRGRFGLTVQEVNAQLAESFGLDRPRGALVSAVEPDGPADKAGVKAGDVILAIDKHPVDESTTLPGVVAHLRPGSSATVDLWRDRKPQQVKVKVAEMEEPSAAASAPRSGRAEGHEGAPSLGLGVRPLTPEERHEVGAEEGGLLIEDATGPAASAGLEPGDVILRAGDKPVRSAADLQQAAKSQGPVALLVQRQGAQLYVPLRPGK